MKVLSPGPRQPIYLPGVFMLRVHGKFTSDRLGPVPVQTRRGLLMVMR